MLPLLLPLDALELPGGERPLVEPHLALCDDDPVPGPVLRFRCPVRESGDHTIGSGILKHLPDLPLSLHLGVVAVVDLQPSIPEIPHLVTHRIQEIPVMAHHQEGTGVFLECGFHRRPGEDVQIVRGFVQDQEVPLF